MSNKDDYIEDWSKDFFDSADSYISNTDDEDEHEKFYSKLDKRQKKVLDDEDEDLEDKVSSKIGDNEENSTLDDDIDTGSINQFNKVRTSEVTGKKVVNYVDNDTFCNAVVKWNEQCKIAKENNKKNPPMPDVIGIQILKMADGLSRRYNFRNYTYIDEMRDDAIYMAVRAVKNFDPSKSNNAFGYFNFVMWRAMTTRIKAEKKENDIKMSLLKDPMYLGYTSSAGDDNESQVNKDRLISVYDQ